MTNFEGGGHHSIGNWLKQTKISKIAIAVLVFLLAMSVVTHLLLVEVNYLNFTISIILIIYSNHEMLC